MITIIAAIGRNGEIGKDNKLLWDLPDEMKVFIKHTKGKTVIMGRKTFESIGKPLPNRTNVVISSSAGSIDGVTVCTSVDEAIALYPDAVVIGGEQIYKAFLPYADELIISHVYMSFPDADSFFPDADELYVQDGEMLHDGAPFFRTYKYKKLKEENQWGTDSDKAALGI